MLQLTLDTKGPFSRTEPVTGTLEWSFDHPASHLLVRLVWIAEGARTRDSGVIDQVQAPSERSGRFPFRLSARAAPNSYDGQLFSIRIIVEAYALEPEAVAQEEIRVS